MYHRFAFAVLHIAASVAVAAAQGTVDSQVQTLSPGITPGLVAAQPAQLDQAIASCLLLGNEEEAALADFAKQHASSDKVKEFAEMLHKHHSEAAERLRSLAPPYAVAAAKSLGIEDSASHSAATAPVGGALAEQIFALEHKAAQECLALTKKELEKHDGADFDKAFAGSQVGGHIGMLAKLKASSQYASPQLKSEIEGLTRTVEQHLDKAREICKEFKDRNDGDNRQASADGSRR